MNTKKNTPIAPIQEKSNSLFESMLLAEDKKFIENECNKYAGRVGLLLSIMYSRDLSYIREQFLNNLSALVQDTANQIDCELCKTLENKE